MRKWKRLKMQKYYYQQGRCEASHYLSQNPIQYESTDEKDIYRKSKMVCHMVLEEKCDRAETCQLLQNAPEFVIDDKINLRDKKLDE